MIIATAGHIDHGKTLLVKALTGTDTDRLPDEKRRGLTIDLGFAYQDIGERGDVLGFIDVPGHEKFVRNMLAGVTNIDYALLIVAADDGVMPQTIEHLDILNLLGVASGAVVITKIDRTEPQRIEEVEKEIDDLLKDTTLERALRFRVSAATGDGVEPLRAHLHDTAQKIEDQGVKGHFRLAIDRCFTLPGAGLVVTGTVFAGQVRTGDQLLVSPAGMPVRVRSLHAQNRESETGRTGQRCALNISGRDLDKSAVTRGDWLAAAAAHAPSDRLDVRLRVLTHEPRSLKHWTPVHVHIGAADLSGRIAVLDSREIAPGESALAQLVLDHKTNVFHGDRFIIRDQSARRTIGGGKIVDPFAPKRGRSKPERVRQLAALETADPAESLAALLEESPGGVDLNRFLRLRNLTDEEARALIDREAIVNFGSAAARFALSAETWKHLCGELQATLGQWHKEKPESAGLTPAQLEKRLPRTMTDEALAAAIEKLIGEKQLARRSELISLPGHQPAIPPQDVALWKRIEPILKDTGLRPPTVRELAKELNMRPDQVERFLSRSVRRGLVKAVSKNRYFTPAALHRLGGIARELTADNTEGAFNAAAFRDRSGIGRNLTIEVLEFFDQVKLTKRRGDMRVLVQPVEKIFPPA